jgi:hypothetical protein
VPGGRVAAGIAVAVVAGIGCGRGDRAERAGDSSGAAAGARPNAVIRVALLADSASAAGVADSLSREGWEAQVGRASSDRGEWPVTVTVPGDADLAKVVSGALRLDSLTPEFIGLQPARTGLAVAVIPVNRGAHGMSSRVRWALSSDRRAVLVVEDPRAVENDPVPNGFVFGREDAVPVQRDSVWDVAPSPDWRRVAYARAYTTRAGETDSVPPSEWHRLAGSVGLLESIVRKNAFPTSGMVRTFGVARPFVIAPTVVGDTSASETSVLPIAEGWRVAWTPDGARLAIGAPPEIIGDDASPTRWRLVDPASGASRGVTDAASLAQLQWVEGPNLDMSTAVDMKQRRAFRSGDLDIESEDGWIRVYTRGGGRLRSPHIIGPGIALTATANGQFIVAIAPNPAPKSYDPPNFLVVYHILRR